MNEMWMTIEGLEGYYAFSNYGRLYNYKRKYFSKGNLNKKTGYYEKLLFKDGKLIKGGGIHKFIYEAFKGKMPKDSEIDHIDGDKSNNAIWNLRLVSHQKNMEYNGYKVNQYKFDGEFLKEYPSAAEASRQTGIKSSSILDVCNNKIGKHKDGRTYLHRTAGGFIWKFV